MLRFIWCDGASCKLFCSASLLQENCYPSTAYLTSPVNPCSRCTEREYICIYLHRDLYMWILSLDVYIKYVRSFQTKMKTRSWKIFTVINEENYLYILTATCSSHFSLINTARIIYYCFISLGAFVIVRFAVYFIICLSATRVWRARGCPPYLRLCFIIVSHRILVERVHRQIKDTLSRCVCSGIFFSQHLR